MCKSERQHLALLWSWLKRWGQEESWVESRMSPIGWSPWWLSLSWTPPRKPGTYTTNLYSYVQIFKSKVGLIWLKNQWMELYKNAGKNWDVKYWYSCLIYLAFEMFSIPSTCISFFLWRYNGRRILYTLMAHQDFDRMLSKHLPANTLRNVQEIVEGLKTKVRDHYCSIVFKKRSLL